MSVLDRTLAELGGVDPAEMVADLRTAFVSRALDDRTITLQRQSRAYFQISGAGHEALLTALARSLRPGHDWFLPYYRDQALVLALGVSPYEVLLQAVGAADDPASGARQLPGHWGSPSLHILTQSSPTGSQCLQAVGCAEATQYARRHRELPGVVHHDDEITYVSLGEGAASEGEFWEAVNQAALLQAPVLFVVEDNGWAISVPVSEQSAAPVADLVAGIAGLTVFRCDGTDYLGSRSVGAAAVDHVRAGLGPALLHATVTRPYSHSSMDDQRRYRNATELDAEAANDPLVRMARTLVAAGVLTDDEVDALRAEAFDAVADAARAALDARRPDPSTVRSHLVGDQPLVLVDVPDSYRAGASGPPASPQERVTLAAALNQALAELLEGDERIRVFGEDVADVGPEAEAGLEGKGGVFGTTKGLQRRFGDDRCFNTPLAEAAIVGRAVGQAMRGLRPCPEIQFFDYIWPAMQQLRSEAATVRWRSNGAFSCPMVLRAPIGGYLTGGAIWHSQCGEAFFAHVPGLRIAFPSTAADAVGLLRAAFRYDDPVLFCEHKHLLRQAYAATPYPDPSVCIPFGVGAVRRQGADLTVVTWGAMVHKSLLAAEELAAAGAGELEVIDLRTIAPWDRDLVAASVAHTGRAMVVQEDTLTAGFGAEIAAWIGDELFSALRAPVRRVGALDTPVPYEPTLERAVLPQVDDVVAAALGVLRY